MPCDGERFYCRLRRYGSLVVRGTRSKLGKVPRIGILWHAGSVEEESDYLPVITNAFHYLGYIEGKNIALEHRFPAEQPDRFRLYARERSSSNVDAIIAVTPIGAKETKLASSTIPIVFVLGSDPVGDRLIDSLARPRWQHHRPFNHGG